MSNERKSIVINADSLIGGGSSGGGSSKRHTKRSGMKKDRKIRPSSIVQPSTLKKTLLERIKQHQRTRERSREQVDDNREPPIQVSQQQRGSDSGGGGGSDDTFSQSIDFLRKLALKRREQQQQTQKHRGSSSSGGGGGGQESKTPEAKMLNQVAETLHNGEIITNTGLLGLPVVPTLINNNNNNTTSVLLPAPQPAMVSIEPMTMPMPMPMQETLSPLPTKITDLAEMYNNTIAGATTPPDSNDNNTISITNAEENTPLHIIPKLEDYMPSIFLKEEPAHGCLKNGKKPTFREWAKKMLGGDGSGGSGGDGSGGNDGSDQSKQPYGKIAGGGGEELTPEQIAGMRVKIRKTKKKSYRIGKHDDVVGVLLKNKQTQRHIQNQHLTLRQKNIGEIRKYLYDHHLLKVGSNAPPDVLRRMYEDSIMTGEVKNTNKDVLLHNFMSGGGGE